MTQPPTPTGLFLELDGSDFPADLAREKGFKYFQRRPVEIIRFPTRSDPVSAAVALLAFGAYPQDGEMRERREANDAIIAWIFRRVRARNKETIVPFELSNAQIPFRSLLSRCNKAQTRLQREASECADVALDLLFRRKLIEPTAILLGCALKANRVVIECVRHYESERTAIRNYLRRNRSVLALADEDSAIRNFRRRTFRPFLSAAPLMIALNQWIASHGVISGEDSSRLAGGSDIPLVQRLLYSSELWAHQVCKNAEIERRILKLAFPTHPFPILIPEQI